MCHLRIRKYNVLEIYAVFKSNFIMNLVKINPLNAELNPIYHLLALLGGATIVFVSRLRANVKIFVGTITHLTRLFQIRCLFLCARLRFYKVSHHVLQLLTFPQVSQEFRES